VLLRLHRLQYVEYKLMSILQTCLYTLLRTAHPRDHGASWSIRTLLQELPLVHAHTRLRDSACYIARQNSVTGSLRVYTTCILDHTHRCPHRVCVFVSLRLEGWPEPQHTAPSADAGGDCQLLRRHNSSQILSATSADPIVVLASPQWPYHHSIQCRAHIGWFNMAYTAWHGVGGIRHRLEPSKRKCPFRSRLAGYRHRWLRGP
jgi:hypothetical protein